MWFSAQNTIKYPRQNLSNKGVTVVPGPKNKNFDTITKLSVGKNISRGTYGSVSELGNDGKYVIKTMDIDNSSGIDLLKVFFNEIRVGSNPAIAEVGPRIYAWRLIRDQKGTATIGQYIMDSFTKGDKDLETISLHMMYRSLCPPPSDPIYAMLRKTIEKFWKITKGYHGDLHLGNVVALRNIKTKNIVKILIFDYGAHKKFKAPTNNTTCFDDFIHIINKEFFNRLGKPKVNVGYYPNHTKLQTMYPERSQPRRSNVQMLKGYSISGEILPRHFSTSMMTSMRSPRSPGTYLSNIKKAGRNFTKQNSQAAFVSPNIFKKMTTLFKQDQAASKIQRLFRKYRSTKKKPVSSTARKTLSKKIKEPVVVRKSLRG